MENIREFESVTSSQCSNGRTETGFPGHWEDLDLWSLNYDWGGARKVWYFFPLCQINDGSEGTAISSDSSVVEDPSVVDSMVKSVNVAPGEGGTPSGVPPASEG